MTARRERGSNATTPDRRIEWLEQWIASLPQIPTLLHGATWRDSMYD